MRRKRDLKWSAPHAREAGELDPSFQQCPSIAPPKQRSQIRVILVMEMVPRQEVFSDT